MGERRFFIGEPPRGDCAALEGSEAHHALHVLRLRPGDRAVLFDGTGMEFHAEVVELARRSVVFRVLEARRVEQLPIVRLVLLCSVVKPKAMDVLVQKCTELGVSELWPCVTRRTSVRVAPGDDKLVAKWRRTAIEAAKQCGRNRLPAIRSVIRLEKALDEELACAHKLLLSLSPQARPLREELAGPSPNGLCVLVGPEGGLEETEEQAALNAGFRPVSLGKYTLRTETAALAIAAAILVMYQ